MMVPLAVRIETLLNAGSASAPCVIFSSAVLIRLLPDSVVNRLVPRPPLIVRLIAPVIAVRMAEPPVVPKLTNGGLEETLAAVLNVVGRPFALVVLENTMLADATLVRYVVVSMFS